MHPEAQPVMGEVPAVDGALDIGAIARTATWR